jgi:hypothetical protein
MAPPYKMGDLPLIVAIPDKKRIKKIHRPGHPGIVLFIPSTMIGV